MNQIIDGSDILRFFSKYVFKRENDAARTFIGVLKLWVIDLTMRSYILCRPRLPSCLNSLVIFLKINRFDG